MIAIGVAFLLIGLIFFSALFKFWKYRFEIKKKNDFKGKFERKEIFQFKKRFLVQNNLCISAYMRT